MHITLLGTGTPMVDTQRQGPAVLLETSSSKLIFDAGRGVTSQLLRVGTLPQTIDAVFITHHHFDHIGNLGDLLLAAWHNGRKVLLHVYGPPGTAEIVNTMFERIYARDIAFALFNDPEAPHIKQVIKVLDLKSGERCEGAGWQLIPQLVNHGNSLGLSQADWPCFGYRIEAEGKVIAISGDAVACEGLDYLAQGADVLIQACYLARAEITMPAFERLSKHVIAASDQVGKIANKNRVKKLVLTHIRPKTEALMKSLLTDVRQDYNGETILGEDLMVFEL